MKSRKVHAKGCHPEQIVALMYQHLMIALRLVIFSGWEVQKVQFYQLDIYSGADERLYSWPLNGTLKLRGPAYFNLVRFEAVFTFINLTQPPPNPSSH